MSKNYCTKAVIVGLSIAMTAALALTACSSNTADSETGQTTPAVTSPSDTGSNPAPDQSASEPATEPAAPSYSGTDANEIIGQLCAIAGCHDSASLLAYSADADAVQRKMESMGSEDYSNLTPEQIQALVAFYTTAK